MKDQAEGLRVKLNKFEIKENAKAIAVVSGKGGVGKSNFSLNFSISLAKRGYKVLLFDMDIGMGNLDILMGKSSERTIVDYLSGAVSLYDCMMDGPEGIKYIGGGSGLNQLVNMNQLNTLAEELDRVFADFDFLIFDMGAGASEGSLKFLLSVHEIIVITTPEPTALMDAYAMMKYLHLLDPTLPFNLVVNRAHSKKEGMEAINRLTEVLKRFLNRESCWLGILPDDHSVQKAVSRQVPFLPYNPTSKASVALEDLVSRYIHQGVQMTKSKAPSFVSKLKKFLFER